jgi:tetratricopeptide (TPR) repeat protein
MSHSVKKSLKYIALTLLGAFILAVLGGYVILRASTSDGISYDPTDEGYCEAYGITIDTTQVDAIYLHPQVILADPEAFLRSDKASLLLAQHHAEANHPFDLAGWVQKIEKIAHLPRDEREQQIPYQFSQSVLAGKETFCKIAGPHILSYLPAWAEISTIYYPTALDPIGTGFHNRAGIVTGLSHPMYGYAERLFNQGSTSIYNIMVHELFHRGYRDAWLWQIERPLENSALRDLIRLLQNDGMAVNAAYRLAEYYPSSLDFTYPLLHFKPYVRYLVGQINQVFEKSTAQSAENLYQDVSRLYKQNVHYIVGGYMAGRIEDQLGRQALVATIETGPMAFIQAYNSVAEEGMELHFSEPESGDSSIYQALRTASLEGDVHRVRENLGAIRADQTAGMDIEEAEGYLLYTSGNILLKSGYLDLAEETFQVHIALLPQVGAAYIGLGDAHALQGEFASAIANYQRALELDPRNPWVALVIMELQREEP